MLAGGNELAPGPVSEASETARLGMVGTVHGGYFAAPWYRTLHEFGSQQEEAARVVA